MVEPSPSSTVAVNDLSQNVSLSLDCSICKDYYVSPVRLPCNHVFCKGCLYRWANETVRGKCAECDAAFDLDKDIIIDKQVEMEVEELKGDVRNGKRRKLDVSAGEPTSSAEYPDVATAKLMKVISDNCVDLSTTCMAIEMLEDRRSQLIESDKRILHEAALEFILAFKSQRLERLETLQSEIETARKDEASLREALRLDSVMKGEEHQQQVPDEKIMEVPPARLLASSTSSSEPSGQIQPRNERLVSPYRRAITARAKRMRLLVPELEEQYINCRTKSGTPESGLSEFLSHIDNFTKYEGFKLLAHLNYTGPAAGSVTAMNIVSSIEFDKDSEYFAVAGVIKRIKIYDYANVIDNALSDRSEDDIAYPVADIPCSAKISCVSYNHFRKNILASSDYEGAVQLWDTQTLNRVSQFKDHEKRCWTVCFSPANTNLLASGGDDGKVKIYSLTHNHAIHSIEGKVNVCCVQFSPTSSNHIAFGTADHKVHFYDLRNTRTPVFALTGHKKAVSYVKFINSDELVSASTDSTLRLWSLPQGSARRTYDGHLNEKNFVGLATSGDLIACGSENNKMYVYYKNISKPTLQYDFSNNHRVGILQSQKTVSAAASSQSTDSNSQQFVSAVSWRSNENVILAANCQGYIRLLELTKH